MEEKALAPTNVSYLTSDNYAKYTTVTYDQVISALGYVPYDETNPSKFISGIDSLMVTDALGYTPYDETNPSKFISGIDSLMVTDALGYTPYDSANPKGYIDSSALAPYLTSETASATYQPRGNYLTTISGLDISQLNNDSGYITSSALEPYLTSATAQSTYVDFSTTQSLYNKTLYGSSYGSNIIDMGSNYSLDITAGLYGVRIFTSADRTLFHEFDFGTDGVFVTPSDISIKGGIVFNGTTSDLPKTRLVVADYLQEATITIPNSTGTIALTTQLKEYYPITNPDKFISGIDSLMVTDALGYTPYNDKNPDKFISGIDSLMVTDALGYTPYDSANPKGYIDSNALIPYLTSETASVTYQPIGKYLTSISGLNISELNNDSKYISGIDSLMVTDALGYTPYDETNPSKFISSIDSLMVTDALGYTPYDSTNPDEFITVRALEGYVPFSGANADLELGTRSVSGVIKSLASSVDFAGLNVPSGIAPINPIEGDIWLEGGVLYIAIGGVTYNFQLQNR